MVTQIARPPARQTKFAPDRKFTIFGIEGSLIDIALLAITGFIVLMQLHLQFVQKINWDEFFYLSHIYDAQAGRLDRTLQMGHAYIFRWLLWLPGGEGVQITTGRVMMWLVQLGTLALIVKTARAFMPFTYALFAALCFIGLGFVYIHGTSFRADPLAALCMMTAIYVFVVSDLKKKDLSFLAGALAIGAFVTIKVILFAPLFLVLALIRLRGSDDKIRLFLKLSVTASLAVLVFLIALFLHSQTLAPPSIEDKTRSLASTAQTMFFTSGIFPRTDMMKVGFLTGFIPTLLVGIGFVAALFSVARQNLERSNYLILTSFILPLISFVFYRNAYPYFYAFIFPSAMILAGYAAYQLRRYRLLLPLLTTLLLGNSVLMHMSRLDDTRRVQTHTLSAIHQIFPEAVSYFDRNGMVSSYPKAGFFMSSWGVRNYKVLGKPQFVQEMERKTIPLLVENSPVIAAALNGEPNALLDQDVRALRENYIQHWGHIWVAGKALSVSNTSSKFSILVPGDYTVEAAHSVQVDGKTYQDGDIITLSRGAYAIESEIKQNVVLRWGRNLFRPTEKPLAKPIFGTF